jgi:hypothetical protein
MITWHLAGVMAERRIHASTLASRLGKHPNTIAAWKKSDTLPAIGGEKFWDLLVALNELSPEGSKSVEMQDLIRLENCIYEASHYANS